MGNGTTSVVIIAALALLLSAAARSTDAAVVNYQDDAPAIKGNHLEGGVLLSGSGSLKFTTNGVGVIGGGIQDEAVDGFEFVDFAADGNTLLASLSLGAGFFINSGGPTPAGDHVLSGYDASNTLVASFNYSNSGQGIHLDDLVARLGVGPLKRISINAGGDSFTLGSILVSTVPEPASVCGVLFVLAAIASRLRSR